MAQGDIVIVAGGLTQSEIDRLKKEHGKLTLITVKDENDQDIHFWFKKPDMKVMSATAKVAKTDSIQAAQIFATNCIVKGDISLLEDVDIFSSLAEPIMELVETREVEVKKF